MLKKLLNLIIYGVQYTYTTFLYYHLNVIIFKDKKINKIKIHRNIQPLLLYNNIIEYVQGFFYLFSVCI